MSREPEGHGRRQSRILVSDDDRDTVSVLADLLSDEGFQVEGVSGHERALAAVETRAYSLVLASYLFYPPDGAMEADARRLLQAAGPTPAGCLTTWLVPEALRGQFAFVLRKPFELEELFAQVGKCTTPQADDPVASALMQRYFGALGARDWPALGEICSESVVYHLPGTHALSATIKGRAAFLAHAEQVFGGFPDSTFELTEISWLPRGAVARYMGGWRAPSGERVQQEGAVLFTFEGGRIAQVGVRMDASRLRLGRLPPGGPSGDPPGDQPDNKRDRDAGAR